VKSLLAVALVAGGVAVLQHVRGNPGDASALGPVVTQRPASSTPTVSVSAVRLTATPTPPVALPPTHRPHPVFAPLVVLNDSRIHGLAHRAAAKFQQRGWPIATITNYRNGHDLAETTVYYTKGDARQLAAARHLVREFPAIVAVVPRPAGFAYSDVTVVLTRDFPA
jgi:hypothetical protein